MLVLDGRSFEIPGAYGITEVINTGGGNIPTFNVPIIIGSARSGIPYNAGSGAEVIKGYSNSNNARKYYGDGELIEAFDFFKEAGAGICFLLNAAALTRAKATLKDNAGEPANSLDIVPLKYGAGENDISLAIASADSKITYTIIPPKNTKFLTADASTTNNTINLESVDGLEVGETVYIRDNSNAVQSTEIEYINKETKDVRLKDLPTSAFAIAQYARIFQEDTTNQEVYVFDSTVLIEEVLETINVSNIFRLDRSTYTGAVPNSLVKTYLNDFSGATKGTSPLASESADGDYDKIAADFIKLAEEFRNYNKIGLRGVGVVSGDASVHANFRALAVEMRSKNYPILVVTGVKKGDIDKAKTDAAHPIPRLKSLNSGDVLLAVMGKDDKAAYLSVAPYVLGLISKYGPKKNLTKETISATKVEKFYGAYNEEDAKELLRNGALMISSGETGFWLTRYISTYQKQDTVWNSADATTYLVQRLQMADFALMTWNRIMNSYAGSDSFDIVSAETVGMDILSDLISLGYITSGRIAQVRDEGDAIVIRPEITIAGGKDFIGTEFVIISNN